MEGKEKNTQQSAQGAESRPPRKKKKKVKKATGWRVISWVFGILFTVLLIGCLTAVIFSSIFMKYVNTNLKGHVEVDASAYDPQVSSELYYRIPGTEDWFMYGTLYLNAENRRWAPLDEIPKNLQQAAIAIEDERFMKHPGVDPKGTVRAIVSTLTGSDVQGGSSITQQMLKNVTGDDEDTVKRKVVEIYRAIAFEQAHSKEEILEIYLNYIYMGESCYGVKTAAKMYFNKELSELTLAECASLIAITNNPSMYDPLISDWTRTMNRNRQMDVLDKMLELGMISEAVYNASKNEEIVFSNGYTCFGNYLKELPQTQEDEDEEDEEAPVERSAYSYFTDQVIEDVITALMEKYGYDRSMAENKVYSGLKIYTTQNIDYQHICEDVFENTTYAEYLGQTYGDPLQAAITLMDPFTGEVLAMVGGTGIKTQSRGWNWATETRQCGSAIKPISTYAPALDNGTISMASTIDDYPIKMNGQPYPRNSGGSYGGLTTVQTALVRSLNTCAVRVNMMYGTTDSYNFMVDKLGFTTLEPDPDSYQVGNMALGGLYHGVTTEEMAAAYGIFVNDGLYTKPYTFVRVEDADGNVLLENAPETSVAIKETTAYLMRETLRQVITSGTGYEAYFSGMSIGGKTGTTDDEYDRYFVGFSPYYVAAVWSGYARNQTIYVGGNPSANLWAQVMSRIHENLEDVGFHDAPAGLTWVSVCSDSGLLATDACTHDLRGNRVRSVLVAADTAPTRSCDMHKMVSYCKDGKHIATEYCPKESIQEVAVLDYDREMMEKIKAADDQYLLKVLSGHWTEKDGDVTDPKAPSLMCPVHNEEYEKKRLEEEEKKKKEEEEKKKEEGGEKDDGGDTKPDDPTEPPTPIPIDPTPPDEDNDNEGGEGGEG